jgi:hypothetical protein
VSIELTQTWLGARPYALVEAKLGPDGDDDLRVVVSYGGGPENLEDVAHLLAMALAELPGGVSLMRQVAQELGTDA